MSDWAPLGPGIITLNLSHTASPVHLLVIHHHLTPSLTVCMCNISETSCSVTCCDALEGKATVRPRPEKSLLAIKYQSAKNKSGLNVRRYRWSGEMERGRDGGRECSCIRCEVGNNPVQEKYFKAVNSLSNPTSH